MFRTTLWALLVLVLVAPEIMAQSTANEARARAYYEQAIRELHAGSPDEALAAEQSARDLLGADNPLLAALRVRALAEKEQWEDAQAEYEVFFALGPNAELATEIAELSIQIDQQLTLHAEALALADGRRLLVEACDSQDAAACEQVANQLLELNTMRSIIAAALTLDRVCRLRSESQCELFYQHADALVFQDCDRCPEMRLLPTMRVDLEGRVSASGQIVENGEVWAISRSPVGFEALYSCSDQGFCPNYTQAAGYRRARQQLRYDTAPGIAAAVGFDIISGVAAQLSALSGRAYYVPNEHELEYALRIRSTFAMSHLRWDSFEVLEWTSSCERQQVDASLLRASNCSRRVLRSPAGDFRRREREAPTASTSGWSTTAMHTGRVSISMGRWSSELVREAFEN